MGGDDPRVDVIAIFGPTGVGKTAVAIALAERLRAAGEDPVAVSADALQVYRGVETLTGAASPEEQSRLEHRLVSFLDVSETFSAGRYVQLAHAEIDGLLDAGRRPIVVGGTGLYLRAALADLDLRPPVETTELEARGAAALHAELTDRAPHLAARLDPADPRRLARSLALLEQGVEYPPADEELWTTDTRRPTKLFALIMEREALYAAIDARVDAMVAAGAADQVSRADAAGASPTARQALGFEQLLVGDIDAMKQRTRQYARRQLTWLRKLSGAHQIDVTGRSPEDVAAEIGSAL
jgi:tRNA dimethylallyltransferase